MTKGINIELIISILTCLGIIITAYYAFRSYRYALRRNWHSLIFKPAHCIRGNPTAQIHFEMYEGEKSAWGVTGIDLFKKQTSSAGLKFKQEQAFSSKIRFDYPRYDGCFFVNHECLIPHPETADIYQLHIKVHLINITTSAKDVVIPAPIPVHLRNI